MFCLNFMSRLIFISAAMTLILSACGQVRTVKTDSSNRVASVPQARAEGLRCDLEFEKVGLCAQMTWLVGPQWSSSSEQPLEVQLDFWSIQSQERIGLDFDLVFDSAMPAMNNHPLASQPIVECEKKSLGTCRVRDILISCLGGNWNFFFQLKRDGGLMDQARFVWIRDEYLVD
jgi:hypothetical protein